MKLPDIDLAKLREHDKSGAAYHEAGHLVVAIHFRITCWCHIKDERPGTLEEVAFSGQARFGCGEHTLVPFRAAAIGWAGVLASAILRGMDTEEAIQDVWEIYESLEWEISPTDLASINRHPMRWRTCTTAARILAHNLPLLHHIAGELLKHGLYPHEQTPDKEYARCNGNKWNPKSHKPCPEFPVIPRPRRLPRPVA
jgi:hypothetical protein